MASRRASIALNHINRLAVFFRGNACAVNRKVGVNQSDTHVSPARRHSTRVGTPMDVSRMENLIDESTIDSYLKSSGNGVGSEDVMASNSLSPSSSSRMGGSRMGSTIAQEIHDMERESNFQQIREEARELKTVLDVTRYARSYLPGKLVNTDMSIAFISDELMLPLMPNENFLETWGDARLTYIERRKIMEKIHLMEDD